VDLTLSAEEAAFRDEIRGWLREHNPGPLPPGGDAGRFDFAREWQRTLHAGGWAGVSWPREFGGRGATLIEQAIFTEEVAKANAPPPANILGLFVGGPTVIAWGTDEQKERWLDPILTAEEIWCQGFSEPDAGSDLAAAKTTAARDDGGGWRVSGQKVWTTFGHEARWCMLLARSDPDASKHKGLTYFICDMEQAGVEVRPLRQITGESEFNELFFENAHVPEENVLGGEGNGWMVAVTSLLHERAAIGLAATILLSGVLEELVELARARGRASDPRVRQRIARLKIGTEGLRLGVLRAMTTQMRTGIPGAEASLAKLQFSEMNQELTVLATELGGIEALGHGSEWSYRLLRARANSIEGGTTEVVKNVIAERILGLPRLR
jgi:alkylation response protein AidB-like acyl-CoA dehydrogenase